jgi:predicted unusual protein kinase regulating ubiquinone biosynthesis (AarF/ABC1/UbiB family)/nucleotide-binding universal stress UspA family protein
MAPDSDLREHAVAKRVMVATDRSKTADNAVRWAASLAQRCEAELCLVQVVVPHEPPSTAQGAAERARAETARGELAELATRLAGQRGRARVVVDVDPAKAIVRAAEEEQSDVLVVGNLGMSGRKEFLLRNVPNRVSHKARCTVVIVNSALPQVGASEATPQGGQAPSPAATEPRLVARGLQIASVMARHGLKALFDTSNESSAGERRSKAKHLREALEELGPTFSKLGQVLSTRPDLLPTEYIEELAALQDHVPPMAEREVVAVMEQELGVPWEDVFASIDPAPLAAGTIGQVHRAKLVSGDRVVVKVQRPNAAAEIEQDLALLKAFAEQVAARPVLQKVIDVEAVFGQLADSLRRELDFFQEASNIERMRELIASYSRLGVPMVHRDLSTSRLLVMQEIPGTPISQAPEGRARKEAARQLLESYYRQVVSAGFFHADPHPGNLMWWQDRIYFLDFGMVGILNAELREHLMWLLSAFWREDARFLTDVALMLSGPAEGGELNVAALQEEIGALMAKYRKTGLAEMQLGPILLEMSEIALRHGVPLPASLTLLGKALAQVQLATAQLDPDLDPFEVAGTFLTQALLKGMRSKLDPQVLVYESQKLKMRALRMLETVERLVGARTGQNLEVNFRSDTIQDTLRRTGRRLAVGLIAASCVLAAGFTAASTAASGWVAGAFVAAAALLTLVLVFDLLLRR